MAKIKKKEGWRENKIVYHLHNTSAKDMAGYENLTKKIKQILS